MVLTEAHAKIILAAIQEAGMARRDFDHATRKRDAAILAAVKDGAGVREIARFVGMSPNGIAKIVAKARETST